ncbi:MAG: hypothetical protein IJS21_05020, partial [Deltaproteobacteria bacterium]|nr:hypothetical protein [Deltaproteobacteria bacterium]
MKHALSRMTSAEARAEHARVKAVEEQLLNALAAKGYTYKDGKVVVSAGEPEKKEGEAVDNQGKVRYNYRHNNARQKSKVPAYDDFATQAMIWARSSGTNENDTKVFYNSKTNEWCRLVADDSDDGYSILLAVKDTAENQAEINDLLENGYENYGAEQRTGEEIYRHYDLLQDSEGNDGNDYINASEQGSGNGRTGGLHEKTSESDGGRDNQEGARNQRNLSFSLTLGNDTVTGQVEQTKNLVALHNLTEQNLLDTIKLVGFPAPSIAIVKADQGHSDYGPITVVFGKETIDPKRSAYNNVFGLDAWTPTYPKIEYKPSEKVLNKIRKKYYDLAKRFGNEEARPLYNYVYDMDRQLDNTRGENGLLQKIYDDPNIQNLYLQDTGKGKVADVYTET